MIREAILTGRAKSFGPLAEAVLFSAARLDHLERTIRPALDQGIHVFCDRFADSTRAYQGALGKVDTRLLDTLERVVVDRNVPDLTFILDLPAVTGLARARSRRESRGETSDRFEGEASSFHEALRRAFLEIAARNPGRCVVIDADRDPDAVEASIWSALLQHRPDLTEPAEAHSDVA
jgi:dTMP kinase